jgi:tetratricopeptide (TPR) repeat protein
VSAARASAQIRKEITVKKNLETPLRCVALSLLLTAACTLAGQPTQAQISAQNGSRGVTFAPEALAAMAEAGHLNHDAAVALHAGRYAEAEATVRQSIALWPINSGVPDEILARALDAQGKEQEALQTYKGMADTGDTFPRNLLPYALLLLKSGRWAQAVSAYNAALPLLASGEVMRANSHFSPDVPEPAALAVAIHIALGLTYGAADDWAGEGQHKEMMAEFSKALQLAPDVDLANYYYGFGWRNLDPKERAKMGSIQQAKAALQKAILLGKGDVKKAAQKVLSDLNKPADKPANKPA